MLPTTGGYYRVSDSGGGLPFEPSTANPPLLDQETWTGTTVQQWAIQSPSAPVFPMGLTATAASSTQVSLTWNAVVGATSYNVKRSTNSGGTYTTIATGVVTTNYTDTVAVGTIYYYVVSAVAGGLESLNSAEAQLYYPQLNGTIIGTPGSWGNSGNTITNVFDNNLNTYFDAPTGNGDWVGLDFGVGVSNVVTQINYCPRSGYESRMVGGIFQGANNISFTGAATLFTVSSQPGSGVFTTVNVTNATAFRYVRFLSPNGGYGNVAELQFYGYSWSDPAPVPTGLSALAVAASQINLAWNTLTNATSYNVKRSLTNGGAYTIVATGVTATNYSDGGLAGGTIYYYVVSAMVAGSESSNSVQAAVATLSPTVGALAHRYSFSETGGSNVTDFVGGPVWNGTLPNGGTFSSGQLILSSNLQQYVNLPAGIVTNMTAVTIEAWATFDPNLPWASWFFGFGNTNNGSGGNCMFCSEGGGRFAVSGLIPSYLGETNAYASGFSWSGQTLHLTCVFNPAGGCVAIYTNGVVAGTNSSGTLTMSSIVNNFSFLNRSLYSTDPYVNLTLNEFRIYNAALSAGEIAATEAIGPDQLLSTNSPAMNMTLTGASLTVSWPLANAGFTLQSRTNLVLGNWVNVTSAAPQIIGGQWQVTLPSGTNAGPVFYRLMK